MEFPIQAEYDLVESVEVRCFGEDLTFYLIITLSDGNCITYDIKSYSCGYDNSYLEIKYSDDETKAKAEQERIESLEKFKREKQEKAKETRRLNKIKKQEEAELEEFRAWKAAQKNA